MKLAILFLASLALVESAWKADPPYYAQYYTGGGGVRGLWVDPSGDLLAFTRGGTNIQVIWEEDNGDGTINVVQRTLANGDALRLNHGVAYHNGFIYASSQTGVYRWPYTPGSREAITTPPQTVVQNIPAGGHDTRTMVFDAEGRILVSCGSNANVDPNSSRSLIRRFSLVGLLPWTWEGGEIFAEGLRNEVGLAWDLNGVLHGVENGADNLNHPIYGDIHNGNPAEEMNRFDRPVGTHYGYPYCFSTYDLPNFEPKTQFSWPSFTGDGVHTDNWCNDPANNQPPLIAMPAHTAPLGMDFYRGQNCSTSEGAFPCDMTGNAVVAFHGSWNSDIPVGYRVGMYTFQNGEPTGEVVYPAYDDVQNGEWRPVNAVFSHKGHLLVSADSQGYIVRVTYGTPPPPVRAQKVLN